MAQRYEITQDDKVYILSTILINDKLRIECQDTNYPSSQTYSRDYTMNELLSLSNIFNYTPTIVEAENELDMAIERKNIRIINLGNIIEVLFTIEMNSFSQEVSFQLFPTQNYQKINSVENVLPPATIGQIISVNNPTYNNVMGFPAYQTNEQNDYPDCTYSTRNPNVIQTITRNEENDYPDCTYSTRNPNVIQTITRNEENDYPDCTYSTRNPNVIQTTTSYEIPMDQDRITKIELDENLVKNEHMRLLQRLNNLQTFIQAIKKRTNNIRQENGILNQKTAELKKIYRDLLEAEAALMAENDELRREKQELILKKNELDFYIRDHYAHGYVKEVNIPLEQKRRRPTNVSKREKQFRGGYSSSRARNNTLEDDKGYSSAEANRTYSENFRKKI